MRSRGAAASSSATKLVSGKLLEVVEHEQERTFAQCVDDCAQAPTFACVEAECLGHGRRDELELADRSEVDECRSVTELGRELVRDRDGEPRLAAAADAGQRQQADVLAPQQGRDGSNLDPAAEQRCGGTRQTRRAGRGASRRSERGILAEDRPLELAQRGAGLDAELLDEGRTSLAVGVERLCLPARPVERDQSLFAEALAVGLLGDQLLEVREQLDVLSEGELGVDQQLVRLQPQLVEPRSFGGSHRFLAEVGERSPLPERERAAGVVGRVGRATAVRGGPRPLEQARAPCQVELVGLERQEVAGAGRLDPVEPSTFRRLCT